MTAAPAVATPDRVATAVRATYVAFIGAGFIFASWASRIPQVRDRLHLSAAELGLVLLAIAGGSLVALPLAGIIVGRLGTRRTVAIMSALVCVGLVITAVGYVVGIAPVLVGLFVLGFANGAWDVAMNVHGAAAEREVGRSIMPRFHAGYSVGTVAGALVGSAMIALHVSVTAHLMGAAVVIAAIVPWAVRGFLPDIDHEASAPAEDASAGPPPSGRALARWREPRTLLIGVFVLAFAFTEGAGNDWISVAVIDGYHSPAVVGSLAFAVFLAAMTTARWFGPGLLDRFGRVPVLRSFTLLALIGLLVFVFAPFLWLGFVGVLLWGAGASLGFPVGMSAASDEPAAAAARVSVVASIGYCAFLAGPPLIGFLGQHFTVLKGLLVVAGLLALAAMIAGALRPLPNP